MLSLFIIITKIGLALHKCFVDFFFFFIIKTDEINLKFSSKFFL